jgi:hypothetical protein
MYMAVVHSTVPALDGTLFSVKVGSTNGRHSTAFNDGKGESVSRLLTEYPAATSRGQQHLKHRQGCGFYANGAKLREDKHAQDLFFTH